VAIVTMPCDPGCPRATPGSHAPAKHAGGMMAFAILLIALVLMVAGGASVGLVVMGGLLRMLG